MIGQFIRYILELVGTEDTLLLSSGDLKAETESEIIAAQEHTLHTKCHAMKILQTETDSKRRLRQHFD
jgi:hypothetical protein